MILYDKNFVEIAVQVKVNREGLKAVLVNDGTKDVWIPKSQIEDPDMDDVETGDHIDIMIPEWLATDKGLI
jgi:cold shock CspA family protein